MAEENKSSTQFEDSLNKITKKGISADLRKMKKDMSSQFGNYREWIREYVVNASDANATSVWITATEKDGTMTITVRDNGHGMDRQGVKDFMTVFRSRKRHEVEFTVGQHGVGMTSVAAIPEQCGFTVLTSTGKQAWTFNTGSLLDEDPINVMPVNPVPEQGSRFDISFKSTLGVDQELSKLYAILNKYLSYLPIKIMVQGANEFSQDFRRVLTRDWKITDSFGRHYQINHSGMWFDVVISLGQSVSQVYQSRVFISDQYNLLSMGTSRKFNIPHLAIRVDSPDFNVPFGRHCLSNEDVLPLLGEVIRRNLLGEFIHDLQQQSHLEKYVYAHQIDEITCALLNYLPMYYPFIHDMKLFRGVNGQRYSLNELKQAIIVHENIYLDDAQAVGIDYSVFKAPVLSKSQPGVAMDILKKNFEQELINLSVKDVVFEAPHSKQTDLGDKELQFQKYLQFHHEVVSNYEDKQSNGNTSRQSFFQLSRNEQERLMPLSEEARDAKQDLEDLSWRVNYLVQRDGKTPCITQRFLLKNNDTVVLNLNHPDVARLLNCSITMPTLAGHWGLAMCLTDSSQRLLSHLSAIARDELILLDAMAKCGTATNEENINVEDGQVEEKDMRTFLRNLEGFL